MKMKNDRVRAEFDLKNGGRLSRFELDGYDLLFTDDTHPLLWGAYPMAPWAGRVRGGQFDFNGQSYTLPLNEGPHSLHGTVMSLPWSQCGDGRMTADLGTQWPWAARAMSDITLDDNALTWTLSVQTHGSEMPVIVGWHPWFNRRLQDGALAHLHFVPRTMFERDDEGLPSGRRIQPTPEPWDDCFGQLNSMPVIQWSNGLSLKVESSCEYWVAYTEPDHALCLEPQSGPPNGFNLGIYETAKRSKPVSHWMRWSW